jgi:formiminotetrahydrofolate cyclodeaminase
VDLTDPAGALSDVAAALAPAQPTPGAGVVAGGIVTVVAGLCESVARASMGTWADGRGAVVQAVELRRRAEALAAENAAAYQAARERLASPGGEAETGRDAALRAALMRAADAPLGICATAADCAVLAAALAHDVDPNARVDAVGAAELAAGAARAAAALVDINLALLPGDVRRVQAGECVAAAEAACLRARGALT